MYAIGKLLIDVIVILFFVGMAGSAVVVVISFVEDFRELFGPDEAAPHRDETPPSTQLKSPAYSYSSQKEPVHHL